MPNRKPLTVVIIMPMILIPILAMGNVSGQERVLKILNLNDSNIITFGNETQPLPSGGIPFTIKVVLEGVTNNLNTFQIGLKFDSSILNCTGAWIPKNDPSFVFYGKKIYEVKDINNTYNPARQNAPYPYVIIGAVLQRVGDYVNVAGGLLALINFTAISPGTTQIEFYPEPFLQHQFTFMLDQFAQDISYTTESLAVTILAAKTPPVASFSFSPKIQTRVSAKTSEVNLTDPTNSTWSGNVAYTCVGWFDYEPSGLNQGDILFMMDLSRENSTWVVSKINILPDKIELTLYSWSDLTVNFDARASYDPDGQIVSLIWDFGDGTNLTVTEKNVSHTYSRRGLYSVNLTVVDDDGASNSVVNDVLVGFPPKALFFTSPIGYPEEAILPGQMVTFNASISIHPENINITRFIWDFGDGNTTETMNLTIMHSYSTRGIFRVKLTAIDVDGLSNSIIKEIQVGIPPLAQFSFDPSSPKILNIEEGVEIFFDASASQGGEYGQVPIVLYVWNFDDGNIEETNETSIAHTYYTPGTWDVTLTVYDADGLRDTFSLSVPVTSETAAEGSAFPWYVVALIVAAVVVIVVVRIRRSEEEEALEI